MSNDNIMIVPVNRVELLATFSAEDALKPLVQAVRDKVDSEVIDVTTPKGRKAAGSLAYKVSRCKTEVDNIGKSAVADIKAEVKKVDVNRKFARDALDIIRDEIRAPLEEWEAIEEARVDGIRLAMDLLRDWGSIQRGDVLKNMVELDHDLKTLSSVDIGESYAEFRSDAAVLHTTGIERLVARIEAETMRIAQEEELTRLRAAELKRLADAEEAKAVALAAEKQAEFERQQAIAAEKAKLAAEEKAAADAVIAKQAADEAIKQAVIDKALAEQATAAAEKKAAADALVAARRATDLAEQARVDRADAERLAVSVAKAAAKREADAIKQAAGIAAAAERQRLEDAATALVEAERKRESNKRHVGKVRREARKGLVDNGVSEATAELVVKLVTAGMVPHVTISY